MLPISLVVLVVLSATAPQTDCFRERRQAPSSVGLLHSPSTSSDDRVPRPTPAPNDCSVGEVKSQLSEDERLDTAGLYILLEEVQCNGSLVSWHTCGFFNPMENENASSFGLDVRIFRFREGRNVYMGQFGSRTEIDIFNTTDSQGCVDVPLNPPFDILKGDLIAVEVLDHCENGTNGTTSRCPLQPNINTTSASSVFYREIFTRRVQSEELKNTINYVRVSINIKASIVLASNSPDEPMSTQDDAARPAEIAGITIGLLAFTVSVTLFSIYVYCRLRQEKLKRSRDHTVSGSDNTTDLQTRYEMVRDAAFSTSYAEITDVLDKKATAKRDTSTHSREQSDRNRFRNRKYSGANAYSLLALEDGESSTVENTDPVARQKLHEMSYSDPYQEPSEGTPHYEVYDDYAAPYWEPANMEDELKLQLARLQVLEIPTEDLKLQDHLGRGQFGTVNRGQWCVSERDVEVAVKSLPAGSTEDERVKFLQEAAIMGQFKHPNILRIHGVLTAEEPLMIVCEMMHQGDLRQHLKSLKLGLSSGGDVPSELPAVLLSFCRQVAAGMGYLAGKSFVHRDLAARNILVSKDDVCKIADFGLSRDLQNEDFYTSHGGKIPVKWTAPEALNYRKYSSTSDVWSYGILLYEIWALGYKPYHELTNSEALRRVMNDYRLPPPSGCPRALYKLMLQCWHPEPESRPSFFEILLVLQRPDFQLLRWSPEDKEAYSEQARTLGGPLEDGKELYNEMQTVYSTPPVHESST